MYLNGSWLGQTWSGQKNENLDLIIDNILHACSQLMLPANGSLKMT